MSKLVNAAERLTMSTPTNGRAPSGLTCAVYARKSTKQDGAGDMSPSVERQIDDACAFARSRGWTVFSAERLRL